MSGFGGASAPPNPDMKQCSTVAAMGTEAYEQGRTDIPLLDETIPQNLLRTIEAHEYREAIVSRHQRIRWNYYEFGERVRDLAKSLMHAGLEKGDRVGLWSPAKHAVITSSSSATAATRTASRIRRLARNRPARNRSRSSRG